MNKAQRRQTMSPSGSSQMVRSLFTMVLFPEISLAYSVGELLYSM